MAAKKTKKKVRIEIDIEVLEKLAGAIGALTELANAIDFAAEDPAVRAKLTKKKKSKRR
jgi:hypothetical protein